MPWVIELLVCGSDVGHCAANCCAACAAAVELLMIRAAELLAP